MRKYFICITIIKKHKVHILHDICIILKRLVKSAQIVFIAAAKLHSIPSFELNEFM